MTPFARRMLLAMALIPGVLGLAIPSLAATRQWQDKHKHDPGAHAMIEAMVGRIVTADLHRLLGGNSCTSTCVMTPDLAICIHPETSPERLDGLLERLPIKALESDRYLRDARWSYTATDGYTGSLGTPIYLTYSFVPDGTIISGGAGEPSAPSELFARLNELFASESEWKQIFADCFADWGSHVGIHYSEDSDDGASFVSSIGSLGVRGDLRIGGHSVDGGYGILAYNYFPDSGDMVLDTDENWAVATADYRFFRNIVMHEHGHGMGLGHPSPNDHSKLMEAYLNTNFLGPQDDDIRGGSRNYGDPFEPDDNFDEAMDLGVFTGFLDFMDHNLTSGTDSDWFAFGVELPIFLDASVYPLGGSYELDSGPIDTQAIMDLGFELRTGADGSEVLVSVNDTGAGASENLLDHRLETGSYFLRVRRYSGNDVQRYRLSLNVEIDEETAVPQNTPEAGTMALSVFPNPFNPQTMVQFYASEAGPAFLEVYDLKGRRLRLLEAPMTQSGWVNLEWDGLDSEGRRAPSGLYFLRARAGGRSETVRGVLLK